MEAQKSNINTYSVNGKLYAIPQEKNEDFLKSMPAATPVYAYEANGKKLGIPKDKINAFLQDVPGAKALYDYPELSQTETQPVGEATQDMDTMEQRFRVNPRAVMGMSVDTARQVAENVLAEPKKESSGWDGFGKELGVRAQRGAEELNQMLANTPDFINRLLVANWNYSPPGQAIAQIGELVGKNWKMVPYDLRPEKYNEYNEKEKQRLTSKISQLNPKHEQGIIESAQKGDWVTFTRNLTGGVADSFAPSVAMMISGAGMTAPQMIGSGLAVFGAGKYAEMDQQAPQMDENTKVLAAAANGALEGIFETYLGSGAVGGAFRKMIAKEGTDVAKRTLTTGLRNAFADLLTKYPALAPLGEGFEEWGTQVAQNYVDKVSGFRPDINVFEGAWDAGLIGIASGASHSAPLYAAKALVGGPGEQQVNPEQPQYSVNPEDTKRAEIQDFISQNLHEDGSLTSIVDDEDKQWFVAAGQKEDADGILIVYDTEAPSGKRGIPVADINGDPQKITPDEFTEIKLNQFRQQEQIRQEIKDQSVTIDGQQYMVLGDIEGDIGLQPIDETGQPIDANTVMMPKKEFEAAMQQQAEEESLQSTVAENPLPPSGTSPQVGEETATRPMAEQPQQTVVNTVRIGKNNYKYTTEQDGRFKVQLDENVDPVKAEKEIRATLPDDQQHRIQLIQQEVEVPSTVPWVAPSRKTVTTGITILPEVSLVVESDQSQLPVAEEQQLQTNEELPTETSPELSNDRTEVPETTVSVDNGSVQPSEEGTVNDVAELAEETLSKQASIEKRDNVQSELEQEEVVAPSMLTDQLQEAGKITDEKESVQVAEADVNTNPTEAQKEAGNYKKGHAKFSGFDITIENPKGSTRSGKDQSGKKWSITLNNSYGYFKRTKGKDGDQVDVFLGPNFRSNKVYVVDQIAPETLLFDEHKVMLGFNSEQEAREAYLSNYTENWPGLGAITEMSKEDFRKWLKQNDPKARAKRKPVSKLVQVKAKSQNTQLSPEEAQLRKENRAKAMAIEPVSLEQLILQYIAGGTRLNWGEIKRELFPRSRTEMNQRIWMLKSDAPTIDKLLVKEGLVSGTPFEQEAQETNVFRNTLLNVVLNNTTQNDMVNSILEIGSNEINEIEQEENRLAEAMMEAERQDIELANAAFDELYDLLAENGELPSENELNNLFLLDYETEESTTDEGTVSGQNDETDRTGSQPDREKPDRNSQGSASQPTTEEQLSKLNADLKRAQQSFSSARNQYNKLNERLKNSPEFGNKGQADIFGNLGGADMLDFGSNDLTEARKAVADAKKKMDKAGDEVNRIVRAIDNLTKELGQVEMFGEVGNEQSQLAEQSKPDQETFKTPLEQKLDEAQKKVNSTQPAEKIEDFGEKIAGAKKDLYSALQETSEADIISQPLSKSFPRPDFSQLVETGALTKDGALITKFLYDNIPSKPRKKFRVISWAKTVQEAIDAYSELLSTEGMDKKWIDKIENSDRYILKNKWKIFKESQDTFGFPEVDLNTGAYEIKEFLGSTGNRISIVKSPYIISNHKTIQEAAEALKKIIESNKQKSKDVKLSVYKDTKTNKYFIGKKTATGVFRLIDNIESVNEARDILTNQKSQLQELWSKLTKKPEERRKQNRERVGTDYRKGLDVSPEQFSETFGFRGTQFGNWVKNDERQESLNDAYDALMDLATAVGVSPKALSLGGELGMAFGARGSGKYSAHYESEQVVINLTKTRGAGSLAHEWWHALDNYFSRKRGNKYSFLTEKPRQDINDNSLRAELIDSFKSVVDVIRKSELPKRSSKLDDTRSQRYWSTIIEMSARSFENFIIEKLGKANEQNDYLANFKETEEWIKSGFDTENYPYPLQEETPVINEAFQNLFDTIEEETIASGDIVLFQKEKLFYSPTEKALSSIKQPKGTPDQMKAMLLKNGAKEAELDWMGWDEFASGKKSLTVVEIQNWIDQNKVEVEEVVKGIEGVGQHPTVEEVSDAKEILSNGGKLYAIDSSGQAIKIVDDSNKIVPYITDNWENYTVKEGDIKSLDRESPTKYSQYQLPGGENYKEVLLTMPKEKAISMDQFLINKGIDPYSERGQEIMEEGSKDPLAVEYNKKYESSYLQGDFKSGHWDESNILAHIRFNERADSEGNKVLFLEEIQSDWAQIGKKAGFKNKQLIKELDELQKLYNSKNKEAKEELINSGKVVLTKEDPEAGEIQAFDLRTNKQIASDVHDVPLWEELNDLGYTKEQEVETYGGELNKELYELSNIIHQKETQGEIADMPFKQTPQWVNLALRRMIRYASENGFDRIAWTTGEQQAERYDLSKQINKVKATNEKGSKKSYGWDLWVTDNNGKVHHFIPVDDADLANTVGKELAEKIINDNPNRWDEKEYSGLDLKVGGEGMKAFYNSIVPNLAGKIGKKFGAKVEPVDFGNFEEWYKKERSEQDPTWEEYLKLPEKEQQEFKDAYRNELAADNKPSLQLSLPVTAKMKQTALEEGMPLFRVGENAATNTQLQGQVRTRLNELQAKAPNAPNLNIIANNDEAVRLLSEKGVSKAHVNYVRDNGGDAAAFYMRSINETFIYLDKMTSVADAVATWVHETGWHSGINNIVPQTEIDSFFDKFYQSAVELGKKDAHIQRIVDFVNEQYDGLSTAAKGNEIGAYLAQDIINESELSPAAKTLWQQFKDWLNKVIDRIFKTGEREVFTEVEMAEIVRSAVHSNFTATSHEPRATSEDTKFLSDVIGAVPIAAQKSYEPQATSRKLTETEAFKKWFGNSKVVDENGEPLVVYHGTRNEFTEFKDKYFNQGSFDGGWLGRGFYFTPDFDYADSYSKGDDGKTMEVFVKAENPMIIEGYGYSTNPNKLNKELGVANATEARKSIREKGYDSVMLKDGNEIVEVVVFSPTQIKSATGNNGGFDPNNPDIRFKKEATSSTPSSPTQSSGVTPPKGGESQRAEDDSNFLADLMPKAAERYAQREAEQSWKQTFEYIREFWQDVNLPIRRLEEEVARRGGRIWNKTKPYRDINLSFGRMEQLYREFHDENMVPVLEAIGELVKASKINSDYIIPYIYAKHAEERNKDMRLAEFDRWVEVKEADGSKVSSKERAEKMDELDKKDYSGVSAFVDENIQLNPDDVASMMVEEFEQAVDQKYIDKLWEAINKASGTILDHWHEGGQISTAQYNKYKSQYKYFVPLRGWRHGLGKQLRYNSSDGFGRSLRHAEGRSSLADNPLPYMEAVAFKAIGERVTNEVNQSLLNLVMANYNRDTFSDMYAIKKVYYIKGEQYNPETGEKEEVWDVTLIKPEAELFTSGDAKTEYFKEHMKLRSPFESFQHEVIVHKDGGDVAIVFADDYLSTAQAFNRMNTIYELNGKLYDANDLHRLARVTGGFGLTNFMKGMMTSLNPVFPFTNTFRDIPEAALTLLIGEANPRVMKNVPVAYAASWRRLFGSPKGSMIDKQLAQFYELGGATGFTHEKTPEEIEKDLKKELKRILQRDGLKGKTVNKALDVFETIQKWNQLFEDTTRFAVYLSALEAGNSKEDSAMLAKEASVNFNRKGKGTKLLDSVWAFFNPAIQAAQKNFKLAKDQPKRFAVVAGAIAMAGFMEALLNDIGDGDDDKYYDLNSYVRQNYAIIHKFWGDKDQYLRIPLPQFWRGFHSLGVIAYDRLVKGNTTTGEAVAETMLNFVGGLSPIDIPGFWIDGEFSISPVIPTWAKPVYEVQVSNRDFMQSSIVKEPFTKALKEQLASSSLHKKNVNPAIKAITDFLAKDVGGRYGDLKVDVRDNKIKRLNYWLDWNPSKFEHLITSYFGGTGRVLSDFTTTLLQVVSMEEEVDINNIPFVNSFIRNTPAAKWSIVGNYYDYREMSQNYQAVENYAKRKYDVEKMIDLSESDLKLMNMAFTSYDEQITNLIKKVGMDSEEGSREVLGLMQEAVDYADEILKQK